MSANNAEPLPAAHDLPGETCLRFTMKIINTELQKYPLSVQSIEDEADLSAFGKKPSKRVIIGISIIVISYIIGWPAVGVLGVLSFYFDEPLLLAVGGPLIYGLSYLVLFLGVYLAGAQYSKSFFRWATRVTMEKLTDRH